MIEQESSRRTFFKRAAAVLGVVVTAVVSARSFISAGWANKNSADDDALQEKVITQSQFVMMTVDEKNQRLSDILGCHEKEIG